MTSPDTAASSAVRRWEPTRLWLALIAATAMAPACAASFDCTKAASKTERLICEDRQLSVLDDVLAKVFQTHEKQVDLDGDTRIDASVVAAQSHWLRKRNVCNDIACLTEMYERRISELFCNSPRLGQADVFDGCRYYELQTLQRELAALEARYIAAMTQQSNAEEKAAREQQFAEESRTWREHRIARCTFHGAVTGGGTTYAGANKADCEAQAVEARIKQLTEALKDGATL